MNEKEQYYDQKHLANTENEIRRIEWDCMGEGGRGFVWDALNLSSTNISFFPAKCVKWQETASGYKLIFFESVTKYSN